MPDTSRREAIRNIALASAGLAFPGLAFSQKQTMMQRSIPSSGEKVGVVGLGTWQTFDVNPGTSATEPLKQVLEILVQAGGSMVDSSPMYGRSEKVVGELVDELQLREEVFFATKVWTTGKESGISQMNSSFSKMSVRQMDLMQIHNLQDWKTHLKTLYDWKEQGKIRYIGITHYLDSAHEQLGRIIQDENIDFLQVNYSLAERNAEKMLLNIALENEVAVITNRPYGGGSLFRKTKGVELPTWAKEIDCASWGQLFLKYLLSHPAVTCVIPGTSKPHHMQDNVGAGYGQLPTAQQRERIKKVVDTL